VKRVILTTLTIYLILALTGLSVYIFLPQLAENTVGMLNGEGRYSFLYPWFLLVLLPLVPLFLLSFTRLSRGQVSTMAFTRVGMMSGSPVTLKSRLHRWPTTLRTLGLVVLVIAVSRPQTATESIQEVEGIDIYLVLDMSGSMQAIDMSLSEVRRLESQSLRPPNRFDIAKTVLEDFVEGRREVLWSDRVGMVIFARQAFLQFPLTIDYATVMWLLDGLHLDDIDASQTAIGNALAQAVNGLLDSTGESKIIVLITDGDERGGNISALSAAQVAADENIQIFPVLVGSQGDVLVPIETGAGFGSRYQTTSYPVDPELLIEVAQTTGGRFFRAENRAQLDETLDTILEEYERTRFEDMIRREKADMYGPFLWAGFLLIGLELFLRYALLRKFP
jgi:Ca-activated chloride channel family protein